MQQSIAGQQMLAAVVICLGSQLAPLQRSAGIATVTMLSCQWQLLHEYARQAIAAMCSS
jgi:hypothetical protein